MVVVNGHIVFERIPDPADAAIFVFPDRETTLPLTIGTGAADTQLFGEVQLNITYAGLPGSQYRTFVVFSGRLQQWGITAEQLN